MNNDEGLHPELKRNHLMQSTESLGEWKSAGSKKTLVTLPSQTRVRTKLFLSQVAFILHGFYRLFLVQR